MNIYIKSSKRIYNFKNSEEYHIKNFELSQFLLKKKLIKRTWPNSSSLDTQNNKKTKIKTSSFMESGSVGARGLR